jgi:hypothetical protein
MSYIRKLSRRIHRGYRLDIAITNFDLGSQKNTTVGIKQSINEGVFEGKIEALLLILSVFKIKYTVRDEDLLRSMTDDAKFDEILLAVIQSQGKQFQDILLKIKSNIK